VIAGMGALAQQVGESASPDELHAEEKPAVGQEADLMRGRDAGVLQLAGELGLFEEAALQLRLTALVLAQDLDGQGAMEGQIAGPVNAAHPATADLLFDTIPAP